jgi:molybdopterin converting factor small subunit
MKIKVKTNFYGQPELQIETPTLKKVLHELSRKIKFSILNPSEEQVHSDFKVYLNGVEHEDLPHGIDTELKEGDKVEITMVVLAGG